MYCVKQMLSLHWFFKEAAYKEFCARRTIDYGIPDEKKLHLLLKNSKRKCAPGMALAVHFSFAINLALCTFN